jgi:hypothetical protein
MGRDWSALYCSAPARAAHRGRIPTTTWPYFLPRCPNRWAELDRLADLRVRFLDETGAFFDAKPYLTTAYRGTTPLMHEIRREGRDL